MTCKACTYISNRISYIAPKVWKPANYGDKSKISPQDEKDNVQLAQNGVPVVQYYTSLH